MCEYRGVDILLGNTFLHYYGVEVSQRPSLQVVMVGSDGKPVPISHTRVAGLDVLRINLVLRQYLFEGTICINFERGFPRL